MGFDVRTYKRTLGRSTSIIGEVMDISQMNNGIRIRSRFCKGLSVFERCANDGDPLILEFLGLPLRNQFEAADINGKGAGGNRE